MAKLIAWVVGVASDLVDAGRDEFGTLLTREVWHLEATNGAGRRFRFGAFEDMVAAFTASDLIRLDGGVDPIKSGWAETYPVYGSLEYVAQEPEMVWNERNAE